MTAKRSVYELVDEAIQSVARRPDGRWAFVDLGNDEERGELVRAILAALSPHLTTTFDLVAALKLVPAALGAAYEQAHCEWQHRDRAGAKCGEKVDKCRAAVKAALAAFGKQATTPHVMGTELPEWASVDCDHVSIVNVHDLVAQARREALEEMELMLRREGRRLADNRHNDDAYEWISAANLIAEMTSKDKTT